MKKMDFTSTLILIGVIACLGMAGWRYQLQTELSYARTAWADTERQIPEIDGLIKELRDMKLSKKQSDEGVDDQVADTYFPAKLSSAGIGYTQYAIDPPREKSVPFKTKKRKTKNAIETETTINFKKGEGGKPRPFSRDNIYAAIYNSEAFSPRWRLRRLQLANEDLRAKGRSKKGYPEELSDRWYIDKMIFVMRRPKGGR